MPLTLNALLADSAAAVAKGKTAWSHMSEYARFHWLASSSEVEPARRGDYFYLRAGAADMMGMTDEAVVALRELIHWAKESGDHATALIGAAHLSFHALNQDGPTVYPLRPAADLLKELAADFSVWRPDADSPTIAESPAINGENVARSDAIKLATAATTAFSTAINVDAKLAEHFAALVRRFGTASPSEADRKLWFAQQHWFSGDKELARTLALDVATDAGSALASRFDANDMLGHFALLEDDDVKVATYWGQCVQLAEEMRASVVAMRHAELTARVYYSEGQAGRAWQLASTTLKAIDGVPVGPIVLDLQEVVAQSALDTGLHREAWDTARALIHWSELTPHDARTSSAYAIATFAGLELGLDEEVLDLHYRRSELLAESGKHAEAAESLQSLAFLDVDAADAYMTKAWELLGNIDGDEGRFARGEWHLTMAQLGRSPIDHAGAAAEEFRQVGHPMKEAYAWLISAATHADQGELEAARQDFAQANVAMPENHGRTDELDDIFDEVRRRLGRGYND